MDQEALFYIFVSFGPQKVVYFFGAMCFIGEYEGRLFFMHPGLFLFCLSKGRYLMIENNTNLLKMAQTIKISEILTNIKDLKK